MAFASCGVGGRVSADQYNSSITCSSPFPDASSFAMRFSGWPTSRVTSGPLIRWNVCPRVVSVERSQSQLKSRGGLPKVTRNCSDIGIACFRGRSAWTPGSCTARVPAG